MGGRVVGGLVLFFLRLIPLGPLSSGQAIVVVPPVVVVVVVVVVVLWTSGGEAEA